MTGVLGAIELVTDSPVPLDETEIAELLAVARSEANQLRSIIDGVVQRTRLDSGTLAIDRRPVSAVGIVEEALARFPDVSDRTAVLGDTALVVATDHSLAGQVLTNLIQNVARYAPSGPVSVTLARNGDSVTIRVTDSGPGLPGGELPPSKGLGVGLSTSQRLAETLGGSLRSVESPGGVGATFEFELPASDETVGLASVASDQVTLPPRARLLQEVADLLVGTSVDRILTGVGRLGREMLGASAVRVYDMYRGELSWLSSDEEHHVVGLDEQARSVLSLPNGSVTMIDPGLPWLAGLTADEVLAVTMRSSEGLAGLLVVGWEAGRKPSFADGVVPALAALALVGVERRSLGVELEFERRVRAEVMDSLPIAISIFAGDPPRLIGANKAEMELLGISSADERPEILAERQRHFDVRFEDGTPLTSENAPVVEAIRTGNASGPFYLRIRRVDGIEVTARTHCAPVCDADGVVIGAVVTSERIGR